MKLAEGVEYSTIWPHVQSNIMHKVDKFNIFMMTEWQHHW